MLYDRPYMRDPAGPRMHRVLTWLMIAIGAVFVLQHTAIAIFDSLTAQPAQRFIADYLAVTKDGLNHGRIWTLITYGFFHFDVLHILLNLLALFLFSRIVLPIMGPQRLLGFFFGSMIVGGVVWYLVYVVTGIQGQLEGVSAVCLGLFAVFATLFPEQPMSFLLIPITVKPKHAAWAIAGVSLFCMAVFEIPGRSYVAHSAHLGGMLAGWLYGRYVHHRTADFALRPSIELPAWMRRRKRAAAVKAPEFTVNVPPQPTDIKAEVDRILDKINSQGFGSLTADERRLLDEARDTLNKR
jgi:membrane associated rhomboid family serine protease